METVEVEKKKLEKILEKNRKDHEKEFEEAWKAYTKNLVKNLESMLKAAKNPKKVRKVELHVNLYKPTKHTDDYDRALEMLKMEVKETVKLSQHEFRNLVEDNWGWGSAFAESYTSNTGRLSKFSN